MALLDSLDRQILTQLMADGRTPVATLASSLGISRGTAQARLNRLVATGAIRRFTIEVGPETEDNQVRAICTVHLTNSHTGGVLRRLHAIKPIQAVHTTNGKWDLVVEITASGLEELDDALSQVRAIPGVANTETSILLRTL